MRTNTARFITMWALFTTMLVPAVAGPPDPFQEAARLYQQGRWSAAYGRFIRLANEGDRDAARIALFMHRYGPTLYGAYWDAQPDERAAWTELAAAPLGRTPAPFQPIRHPDPAQRRSAGAPR